MRWKCLLWIEITSKESSHPTIATTTTTFPIAETQRWSAATPARKVIMEIMRLALIHEQHNIQCFNASDAAAARFYSYFSHKLCVCTRQNFNYKICWKYIRDSSFVWIENGIIFWTRSKEAYYNNDKNHQLKAENFVWEVC